MISDTPAARAAISPFIVWTFRRTGGTNLADGLFKRSGLPSVQHEPFNKDRVYGQIAADWEERHDRAALGAAVVAICEKKVLMKHCLEIAPSPLNLALAQAAAQNGYRHLFLYRRDPLERLLSLEFAQRSGIWGARKRTKGDVDPEIFAKPLSVQALVSHERNARQQMASVYRDLRALHQEPLAVAFEDVFATSDQSRAERLVGEVLQALGLDSTADEDRQFFRHLLGRGDGVMREQYARFVNHDELSQAVGKLGGFSLRTESVSTSTAQAPNEVVHCALWKPVHGVEHGRFTIGGVVVLAPGAPTGLSLCVVDGEGEKRVEWGLPSPRMAARFPGNPHAADARFEASRILIATAASTTLWLQRSDGSRAPLGQFLLNSGMKGEPSQP